MFYEVVEITFDSKRAPDTIENIIGRYKDFNRASADAKTHYDKNMPKGYKTIVGDSFYLYCSFIAEKISTSTNSLWSKFVKLNLMIKELIKEKNNGKSR